MFGAKYVWIITGESLKYNVGLLRIIVCVMLFCRFLCGLFRTVSLVYFPFVLSTCHVVFVSAVRVVCLLIFFSLFVSFWGVYLIASFCFCIPVYIKLSLLCWCMLVYCYVGVCIMQFRCDFMAFC